MRACLLTLLLLISLLTNTNCFKWQNVLRKAMLPIVLLSPSSIVLADDLITNPNTVIISKTADNLIDSNNVDTMKDNIDVYFGAGCFWHISHEFYDAEKRILGRNDDTITSRTGYAGGSRYGKVNKNSGNPGQKFANGERQVCYHNLMGVSDYGDLGHGEVVELKIPSSSFDGFVDTYFSLFVNGNRPDVGDKGPEYRSLVGIPGGYSNTNLMSKLEKVAKEKGFTLVEGKGDDQDTLGKKMIWIMDTEKFPFNQAELYHQFHDGFMINEFYPQSYNDVAKSAYKRGLIQYTGCPDSIPN